MKIGAFSVELKMGTLVGSYWLLVVTGGAEPQEGGGIVWAWIADLKVYPGITMPDDGVRARWDSGGYRRPFCYNFMFVVDNIFFC